MDGWIRESTPAEHSFLTGMDKPKIDTVHTGNFTDFGQRSQSNMSTNLGTKSGHCLAGSVPRRQIFVATELCSFGQGYLRNVLVDELVQDFAPLRWSVSHKAK
jgi:hypothetical protein